MLRHLPNALTVSRLALSPVAAWLLFSASPLLLAALSGTSPETAMSGTPIIAATLFCLAALSDLVDGLAARALNAGSRFGRLLDPIADKALVGLPLLAASLGLGMEGWAFWPVLAAASAAIIGRDLLITWLRLSAPDGEGVPVSALAKWKTALELLAVGALFLAPVLPTAGLGPKAAASLSAYGAAALALILGSAVLSLVTAGAYLRKSG